jgi:lipooligosaccharide transport system permease protein
MHFSPWLNFQYLLFVAPALLASSAMNGAIFEVTFNVYGKLRWDKVYDAMLATPLHRVDMRLQRRFKLAGRAG